MIVPLVPDQKPYETDKDCPVCAPKPKLTCVFESIFAGSNKTRHLECPNCGYRTQDVVNEIGQVILSK